MAKNYYKGTVVLKLQAVTPVIKALFGPFNLDPTIPGYGEAYITKNSEDHSPTWGEIDDNLQELALEMELRQSEENMLTIDDIFKRFAKHFGLAKDLAFKSMIEHLEIEHDEEPDLNDLFDLAIAFNDGHELTAYKLEAAWYPEKPRIHEYGGDGRFCGRHIYISGSTRDFVSLGEKIEAAVVDKNTDAVAELINQQINSIMIGLSDCEVQKKVRAKLIELVSQPESKQFAK